MGVIKCLGCTETFKNSRGFANHKRKCKGKIKAAAAVRLNMRLQNIEIARQRQQEAALEALECEDEQEIQTEMEEVHDEPVC
jgi:hypothetical protein